MKRRDFYSISCTEGCNVLTIMSLSLHSHHLPRSIAYAHTRTRSYRGNLSLSLSLFSHHKSHEREVVTFSQANVLHSPKNDDCILESLILREYAVERATSQDQYDGLESSMRSAVIELDMRDMEGGDTYFHLEQILLEQQGRWDKTKSARPIVIRGALDTIITNKRAWSLSSLLYNFSDFMGTVRLTLNDANSDVTRFVYSEDDASTSFMSLREFVTQLVINNTPCIRWWRNRIYSRYGEGKQLKVYMQAIMDKSLKDKLGSKSNKDISVSREKKADIWSVLSSAGYVGVQAKRLWLSEGGSVTPVHFDSSTSLLAQLRGTKVVKLWHPDPKTFKAMKLYPNKSPHRRRSYKQSIDDIVPSTTTLYPGDVIVWPERWPHHIVSCGKFSVSVTERFRVPKWRAPRKLEEVRRLKLAVPVRDLEGRGGKYDDDIWGPIVNDLKQKIIETLSEDGLVAIFIRGSLAKAAATTFVSDVDLVVVLTNGESSLERGNLKQQHAIHLLKAWLRQFNKDRRYKVATKAEIQIWFLSDILYAIPKLGILHFESKCIHSVSSQSLILLQQRMLNAEFCHHDREPHSITNVEDSLKRLRMAIINLEGCTEDFELYENERVARWCLKSSLRVAGEVLDSTSLGRRRMRCLYSCCEKLQEKTEIEERWLAAALVGAVRGPKAAWGAAWEKDCLKFVKLLVNLCEAVLYH